jgi:FAD/FMN-containing dehydrogenase
VISANGGLMINTSRMTETTINPGSRYARVQAGVRWSHVLPAAAEHGLAGISGSGRGGGAVAGGGAGAVDRWALLRALPTEAVDRANFMSTEDISAAAVAWAFDSYDRLFGIKKTYDPANIFRINHNIA